MNTADANQSQVILANDPDADRLAIAEKQPRSGNQNSMTMVPTVLEKSLNFGFSLRSP